MKQNQLVGSTNSSLYNIAEELQKILDDLADQGGEFEGNQEAALLTATGLLSEKTDSCVGWYQSQEDLISLITHRINELNGMKKKIQTRLENFEGYVVHVLGLLKKDKLEGELYSVKRRKPTKVVIIDDETQIPMDYINIPQPKPTIMNSEIAKDLKAGKEIPGARLADSTSISLIFGTK